MAEARKAIKDSLATSGMIPKLETAIGAVEAGVDSIEHGTILNLNITQAMKKRGTFLVPTVYLIETFDLSTVPEVIRGKAEIIGQEAYKGLQLAIREQVPIAYGTDAGVFPHGNNGKQFAVLVKALALRKTHHFDISHHVTFVNDWFILLPSLGFG